MEELRIKQEQIELDAQKITPSSLIKTVVKESVFLTDGMFRISGVQAGPFGKKKK